MTTSFIGRSRAAPARPVWNTVALANALHVGVDYLLCDSLNTVRTDSAHGSCRPALCNVMRRPTWRAIRTEPRPNQAFLRSGPACRTFRRLVHQERGRHGKMFSQATSCHRAISSCSRAFPPRTAWMPTPPGWRWRCADSGRIPWRRVSVASFKSISAARLVLRLHAVMVLHHCTSQKP